MNKMLRIAGVAAIISIVLVIFLFVLPSLDIILTYFPLFIFIITILWFITSILVLVGYAVLSKKTKSSFLWIMVLIALIFVVIAPIIYMILVSLQFALIPFLTSWLVIFLGIIYVLFGVGVLKLKKALGNLAPVISVLYMIKGVFYLIAMYFLVLSIAVTIFGIAISILEAILFFRAAKKF